MKHEKISIKWRVFTYLLVFTGILLVVLWLIQICYLDSFYTMIKSREAEQVTSAVANILTSDEDDKDTLIHDIAAKNNMAVYVTNTDGNEICSAEYIVNSRLADMPSEQVQYYYEQAKEPAEDSDGRTGKCNNLSLQSDGTTHRTDRRTGRKDHLYL